MENFSPQLRRHIATDISTLMLLFHQSVSLDNFLDKVCTQWPAATSPAHNMSQADIHQLCHWLVTVANCPAALLDLHGAIIAAVVSEDLPLGVISPTSLAKVHTYLSTLYPMMPADPTMLLQISMDSIAQSTKPPLGACKMNRMEPVMQEDLLFAVALSRIPRPLRCLPTSVLIEHLNDQGFAFQPNRKRLAVLDLIGTGHVFNLIDELADSAHWYFIYLLSAMPNDDTLRGYLKAVVFQTGILTDDALQQLVRLCTVRAHRWTKARQYAVPTGILTPKLRGAAPAVHGFRPAGIPVAENNQVIIYCQTYDIDELNAPPAELETTYSVNGYRILFQMNNFSSFESVRVVVHESLTSLANLHDTVMDGQAFRHYFDPARRLDNIKALMTQLK